MRGFHSLDSPLFDVEIDVPCDSCGGTFSARIRELLPRTILNCPRCGWPVTMTGNFLENLVLWVGLTVNRHRDVLDQL